MGIELAVATIRIRADASRLKGDFGRAKSTAQKELRKMQNLQNKLVELQTLKRVLPKGVLGGAIDKEIEKTKTLIRLIRQRNAGEKLAEKERLAGIRRVNAAARTAERARLKAIRRRKEEVRNLTLFMAAGAAAIAAGLVAFTKATVISAGQFEQLNVAFETMFGSAELARKKIEELQDFAAKTPFTLPGVESAARSLLAVGFTAEELLPTLKTLGDISAGLGRGEEGLRRLILNMGQVRAQAKLTGRELRDFAILGVPIIESLADIIGVTTAEVQRLTQAGEISSELVVQAFTRMTQEGGRFANLMEKINLTALGLFSNLKDEITLTMRALGEGLIPVISRLEESLIKFTRNLRDSTEANKAAASGALIGATAFSALAASALAASVAIQFFNLSIKRLLIISLVGIALLALSTILGAIIFKFGGGKKAAKEFKDQMDAVDEAIKGADVKIKNINTTLSTTAEKMKSKLTPVLTEITDKFKELGDTASKIVQLDKATAGLLSQFNEKDFDIFIGRVTKAIGIIDKELGEAFAKPGARGGLLPIAPLFQLEGALKFIDTSAKNLRVSLKGLNVELSNLVTKLRESGQEKSKIEELNEQYRNLQRLLLSLPNQIGKAIFGIKEFGEEGRKAADLIIEAMKIVRDEMNKISGVIDKIKDAMNELAVLTGKKTKFNVLGEKLLGEGASVEKVRELILLLKEIEAEKRRQEKKQEGREKFFKGQKERRKEFESRALDIFDRTRKPIEQFRIAIAKLREVRDRGLISPETFRRALNNELKGVADAILAERDRLKPKALLESGSSGIAQFGQRIQDALLGQDAEARDKARNELLQKQLIAQEGLLNIFDKGGVFDKDLFGKAKKKPFAFDKDVAEVARNIKLKEELQNFARKGIASIAGRLPVEAIKPPVEAIKPLSSLFNFFKKIEKKAFEAAGIIDPGTSERRNVRLNELRRGDERLLKFFEDARSIAFKEGVSTSEIRKRLLKRLDAFEKSPIASRLDDKRNEFLQKQLRVQESLVDEFKKFPKPGLGK